MTTTQNKRMAQGYPGGGINRKGGGDISLLNYNHGTRNNHM